MLTSSFVPPSSEPAIPFISVTMFEVTDEMRNIQKHSKDHNPFLKKGKYPDPFASALSGKKEFFHVK